MRTPGRPAALQAAIHLSRIGDPLPDMWAGEVREQPADHSPVLLLQFTHRVDLGIEHVAQFLREPDHATVTVLCAAGVEA